MSCVPDSPALQKGSRDTHSSLAPGLPCGLTEAAPPALGTKCCDLSARLAKGNASGFTRFSESAPGAGAPSSRERRVGRAPGVRRVSKTQSGPRSEI